MFSNFLNTYYKPIKNYKIGAYLMKHDYEKYFNTYISEDDFIEIMNSYGYKHNRRNQFKFTKISF